MTQRDPRQEIAPYGDEETTHRDAIYHPMMYDAILKVLQRIAAGQDSILTTEPDIMLDEFISSPASTTATLNLQIDRPALITCIITSIPSATAGLLSIGQAARLRQFNVTPGQAPMSNILMVVYPNDPFILTITGGTGLISIEVMGGILRGNAWRVV